MRSRAASSGTCSRASSSPGSRSSSRRRTWTRRIAAIAWRSSSTAASSRSTRRTAITRSFERPLFGVRGRRSLPRAARAPRVSRTPRRSIPSATRFTTPIARQDLPAEQIARELVADSPRERILPMRRVAADPGDRRGRVHGADGRAEEARHERRARHRSAKDLTRTLRPLHRRRPHHVRRSRGRGLRLPRRERRRQDHGDPDAHRPARAERRRGDGRRATTSRPQSEAIKRNIGYMSQRFSLYEDLTVAREHPALRRHLRLSRPREIRERTEQMLRRLGLEHAATTLVRSIPLGWRQKLAFSVALLHEPRIVFLDEPTSGVDPITRRQFWELIYETAARGHDRARHDALHGRGGVLRPHLDHGGRAHRGARHARRA